MGIVYEYYTFVAAAYGMMVNYVFVVLAYSMCATKFPILILYKCTRADCKHAKGHPFRQSSIYIQIVVIILEKKRYSTK